MASSPLTPSTSRIEVLDYVRGLAIIHIILYHYFMEWFHGSFLIVPEGVAANMSRLEMFHDGGVLGFVKNMFGFLWVYGFFSVNLFLVLSGFVLTYSALKNEIRLIDDVRPVTFFDNMRVLFVFYWKKMKRVLIPLYISILIGIGFLYLRNVLFPSLGGAPIYTGFDVLKLFFVPLLVFDIPFLQKFNGDLWFITLILQVYILFPLLYRGLKSFGVWKFLALLFAITVGFRYLITYQGLSSPMGVIADAPHSYRLFSFFLPRLVEFGFGMGLAYLFLTGKDVLVKMSGWRGFLGGVALALTGFVFDMYRWGWPYADLMAAVGLFVVFLNIGVLFAKVELMRRVMVFLSDSSYENFLLHHYFLNYFLMPLLLVGGLIRESVFWLMMPVFVVGSVGIGWAAQKIGAKLG